MTIANSATTAIAGVAKEKLRPAEKVTFRLMPVPSRALSAWNRRVADWMSAP